MTIIVLSFARLITKFCAFLNTTSLCGATNVGDLFLIWKSKLYQNWHMIKIKRFTIEGHYQAMQVIKLVCIVKGQIE